ncbi:SusC/RagA family TonB-linked outer membrane protein [Chitinophaga flava]|nr:hypothetical protein [Chitinophaga flava]
MKGLILLLVLPGSLLAQVQRSVDPVVSKDYLNLIGKDRSLRHADSSRSASEVLLHSPGANKIYDSRYISDFRHISELRIRNGYVTPYLSPRNILQLTGTLGSTVELKTVNRLPAVQQYYAQGRSNNGALQWRGAETGEMFSYGPALRSLEFDGAAYPYDPNGKLVSAGSGNGTPAKNYHHSIFRPGLLVSTSLDLNGVVKKMDVKKMALELKLEHTNENTVIRNNDNQSKNLSTRWMYYMKRFTLDVGYKYRDQHLSNTNRNGFFNRTFQQYLLTPASFDNAYTKLSYRAWADNPLSLLKNNDNNFFGWQHNAGMKLNYQGKKLEAAIEQSGEYAWQNATEAYKPGTSGFPDGILTRRTARDLNYGVNTHLTYKKQLKVWSDDHIDFTLRHILSVASSMIQYSSPETKYNYQRTVNELLLQVPVYFAISNDIDAKVELANRAYLSNTASRQDYWLPAINANVWVKPLYSSWRMRFFSMLNYYDHELPVNKSLAYLNLLRYNTFEAGHYFPVTEVAGYDRVNPVRTREWSMGTELTRQRFVFQVNAFNKFVKGDVFPLYDNANWVLRNLADHRTSGYELLFGISERNWGKRLQYNGNISYSAYRNKVINVADGMDYTPIAGFKDVNKAVIEGQPLGAIVGSTYRRNAAGQLVIGPDGFPMADKAGIIGNPIPDFILKHSSRITYRNWIFQAALEWKKGGDTWNGTQAMLDYYGRSASSGTERNVTGYVFEGVTEDGHPNTKPVTFYDPAKPLEDNRWVRYGPGGIAEAYIRKADYLRLQSVQLSYTWRFRKYLQELRLTGYVNNLLLWTPYNGVDPSQLLFDQPNSAGLDFFNLPSVKTFGCNALIKF